MTVSWPVFFASAALVFLVLNGTFALVFLLGHEPIANAPTGSFMDLFYFSIETLATVGYGDMHPQTHFGHVVARRRRHGSGKLPTTARYGAMEARFASGA
jgi:inward rectifier potassium channel